MSGYPVDLYSESYPLSVLQTVDPPTFQPDSHTVAEVKSYVLDNPAAVLEVLRAELDGKARSTLVTWLFDHMPMGGDDVGEPNANGAPAWADQLYEQSYGSPEEPEAEPAQAPDEPPQPADPVPEEQLK